MSSVKKTLVECLCLYPSLYHCKLAVYDQLFLTIGNGLEWFGGELVDDTRNPKRLDKRSVKQIQQEALNKLKKDQADDTPYSDYAYRLWEFQIKNVLALIKDDTGVPEYTHFYRIHPGYSHITTIPDDIKPDWFQVIKDFLRDYRLFLASRHAFSQHYFMSEIELQKEISSIEDIKKRINQIEAKFLEVSDEEYLKILSDREKLMRDIIREVLNEDRKK